MIGGGLLLLVIALSDILTGEKSQRQAAPDDFGVVPIGIPLLTGPAALTTCVLLSNTHGRGLEGPPLRNWGYCRVVGIVPFPFPVHGPGTDVDGWCLTGENSTN